MPDRVNHALELQSLIEEVLLPQDACHWVAKLEAFGVPGGPINSYDQALSDPHFVARRMIEEVEHPKAGRVRTLGIPAKLSETPGRIRSAAPMLGQHTAEVLKDLLGMQHGDLELL